MVYGNPYPRDLDSATFVFLAKLYVLSERLLNDKVCDSTVAIFMRAVKRRVVHGSRIEPYQIPDPASVHIMYSGTHANSPGRRCLTDLVAFFAHPALEEDYQNWLVMFPEKFKEDLVWAPVRRRAGSKYRVLEVEKEWLKSTASLANAQAESGEPPEIKS